MAHDNHLPVSLTQNLLRDLFVRACESQASPSLDSLAVLPDGRVIAQPDDVEYESLGEFCEVFLLDTELATKFVRDEGLQ